ncbi:MAG: methyltransferase domain-containing protein [Rhodobacteraceae bacterium]|nr:methyltransferase domain-containing protein [Paracoccaceae bacterium]
MNLETLKIHDLVEDPERLERVMAEQQASSQTDPGVRSLLESIYLEPDRARSFSRFLASFELRTILDLLNLFGVGRDGPVCEIGGGPGFLSWALAQSGFSRVHLLEPNAQFNTGTGYLRTRDDAKSIVIHNELGAWHADAARFDVILTKNCIHHFKNMTQAAATIRQKMNPHGRWFAFREWFADSPREVYEQIAGHPYCQRYSLYEWPYPAHQYVENIELAGFKLTAIVPAGYANNTLAVYQENAGNADIQNLTMQIDGVLRTTPQVTVDAFWKEVAENKSGQSATRFFSRPQLMVFEVSDV